MTIWKLPLLACSRSTVCRLVRLPRTSRKLRRAPPCKTSRAKAAIIKGMSPTFNRQQLLSAAQRINVWYVALVLVLGIFGLRAFYVQVIRYDYYHQRALSDQLKQATIPASRGIIEAHD